MKKLKRVAFIVLLVGLIGFTRGQITLSEWSFTTNLDVTAAASGVTGSAVSGNGDFSSFAAGNSTSPGTHSPHLRAGGWATGTPEISWTLTPGSGNHFDFSLGEFSVEYRFTSSGPTGATLQADTGSGLTSIGSLVFTDDSTWRTASVSLASIGVLTADTGIDFLLSGFTGQTTSNQQNLDTFSVTGMVTPIPEPGTYAAIGGILALGLVLYRRRKQARRQAYGCLVGTFF